MDTLINKISTILGPFKSEWKAQQIAWSVAFKQRTDAEYLVIKAKLDRMNNVMNYFKFRQNKGHRKLYNNLVLAWEGGKFGCRKNQSFKFPKADLKNKLDMMRPYHLKSMDSIIESLERNLDKEWQYNCKVLIEKLARFEINENAITAKEVKIDENGIDTVLIDGKPREIHARVIWAALDSPFVQPHLRHICTERKTK